MLEDGGQERFLSDQSKSSGFLLRGAELQPGAVVTQLPEELSGAEASVCGVKAFLIDERRAFKTEGGEEIVDCAKVAALDITDSPVHVHGETLETYQILAGHGTMVLGDEILKVEPGTFVLIPPGVPHGLAARDTSHPVRVLMTFTPGMAPVSHQQFRDERIVHPSASEQIAGG